MTGDEKIQRIVERAVQSAFVDFPDAGNGTSGRKLTKSQNECKTVATASPLSRMRATELL